MGTQDEIGLLVSASIQARIIQAFHEAPEAIDKLVEAALGQEVNEHGHKPDSWSHNKMPYLEWLVGNTIRNIARAAVIGAVEERKADIETAVRKAVQSEDMVAALMTNILGTLGEEYKMNITFADEKA